LGGRRIDLLNGQDDESVENLLLEVGVEMQEDVGHLGDV
jgi:hypothetical protein